MSQTFSINSPMQTQSLLGDWARRIGRGIRAFDGSKSKAKRRWPPKRQMLLPHCSSHSRYSMTLDLGYLLVQYRHMRPRPYRILLLYPVSPMGKGERGEYLHYLLLQQ